MKFSQEVRHLQTDMLVIGSGVAGMLAVVGAMRSGVTPMIATNNLATAQLIALMSQQIHERNVWMLTYVLQKTFQDRYSSEIL